MKATKNKFSFLQHVITAFTLILKGYDKITHHYLIVGSVILLCGLSIIAYAIYEKRAKTDNDMLSLMMHFAEGIVMLLVTYIFVIEGKRYIQYVTLITAIGFFIATYIHYGKMKNEQENGS